MAEGCHGVEITITEKICPQCGEIVELFSVDTAVACDNCGFVVYNDTPNCVQWCRHARECVGEEQYNRVQAMLAELGRTQPPKP